MSKTTLLGLLVILYGLQNADNVSSVGQGRPRLVNENTHEWRETIHNKSKSGLEAFVSSFRCSSGAPVIQFYDARFIYTSETVIPPSGNLEIKGADPETCRGGIGAAIFSDGHTEGDKEQVHYLFENRRGAYSALTDIGSYLEKISNGEITAQDLLTFLDAKRDVIRVTYTPWATGYGTVCAIVRAGWNHDGGMHVPSDRTPQRLPTVSEVMQREGKSRDQAQAVVIAGKLAEWKAALESHTTKAE